MTTPTDEYRAVRRQQLVWMLEDMARNLARARMLLRAMPERDLKEATRGQEMERAAAGVEEEAAELRRFFRVLR